MMSLKRLYRICRKLGIAKKSSSPETGFLIVVGSPIFVDKHNYKEVWKFIKLLAASSNLAA